MRSCGLVLAFVSSILVVQDVNGTVKPHAPFVLMYVFHDSVKLVTVRNVPVPKGSLSNPCQVGNSCWQELTDRQYAFLLYLPGAGEGTVFLIPENKLKAPSAIIVTEKGIACPAEADVGLDKELQLNDADEAKVVVIVYSEDVESVTLGGNISFPEDALSPDMYRYLEPHRVEQFRGKPIILLTGVMQNTTLNYVFTFARGERALHQVWPNEYMSSPALFHFSFSDANRDLTTMDATIADDTTEDDTTVDDTSPDGTSAGDTSAGGSMTGVVYVFLLIFAKSVY